MSQAFVKENDDNGMLHQIAPTFAALTKYLQVENSGKQIFLQRSEAINGVEHYHMSNGFTYFINRDNNWEMLL